MADAPSTSSTGAGAAAAPDAFISYARGDRAAAQTLAAALAQAGVSVWWDRQLAGGQDFTDVIAERLAAARVVLVLWSRASVTSNFVRDEASRAREAGKLLPVRIEDVRAPLGFGTIHTLDLLDWDGDREDPAWAELLANVTRGPGGRAQDAAPHAAAAWRRWRRPLLLAVLAAVLLGGAALGWHSWREQQALAQLQDGLSAHFARDRNLQAARNAYLSALRIDPELGRAHYYLAHVYALLILPRDARTQFGEALSFARDLDPAQRDDAKVQLAALNLDNEAAAVTRDGPPSAAQPPIVGAPAAPSDVSIAPAPASDLPRLRLEASVPPHLPRIAPSPEQQRAIQAQVDALFAPLAQTRLSAATVLALDPGLLADALPLAVDQSLSGLREVPPDEAAAAGATNTLQLLLGASPATLNANRDATLRLLDASRALGENPRATALQVRTLLDKAQASAPPLAYIQIADESQRDLALALAARIRASGYAVPGIENVGARAPSRSEVRVQGGSAPGWGRWLLKIVSEFGGEPARLSTLRAVRPANDSFEIWLDKDLCTTAERRVPACGA